jgi:hypothetical protein
MSENQRIKYSVVFLLEIQNADFFQYMETVDSIFASRTDSYEVIIIANGMGPYLKQLLKNYDLSMRRIKAFEISNKASQAVCLKSILKETSGEYMFVCGSFQQITGQSFENILDAINDDTDIISPWRQNRHDPPAYKVQSDIFNTIVRLITGTKLHDLSCNVRVFRREVIEDTELYGNMYRFLPIYASRKGFKCKEVGCEHYKQHGEPRQGKAGFYFLSVYINRIIDIFTLYFNTSFSRKPLRFFISIGIFFSLIGVGLITGILIQKFVHGYPVGDRPSLLLSVFFMVAGAQAAGVGLLGEIIVFTHGRQKKEFVIDKII